MNRLYNDIGISPDLVSQAICIFYRKARHLPGHLNYCLKYFVTNDLNKLLRGDASSKLVILLCDIFHPFYPLSNIGRCPSDLIWGEGDDRAINP